VMSDAGMASRTYDARRGELKTYFDRTAADAWSRLTSDAPVSRIRATVRAGRDAMRAQLLSWLPADLTGKRILDAGCGTGAFSVEMARRGADVVAIDLSPTLVSLARDRSPKDLGGGSILFTTGDMLDPDLGDFDHVVAMDSLIHYPAADIARSLTALAARTRNSIVFTFAPRTTMLATMHGVGKLFPRADRSPAIEPVAERDLSHRIAMAPDLQDWRIAATQRVARGFYISQGMELARR
jgi:magnesium-protoporphyrin O-methyltransferase